MKTAGQRPKPERWLCRQCAKRLPPHYAIEWVPVSMQDGSHEDRAQYTGVIRGYGYRSSGLFCNAGCAYKFATFCVLTHNR